MPLPLHPAAAQQATCAPTAKELAEQPRLLLVQAGQQLGQHAGVLELLAAGLSQPGRSTPCCWARCCRSWPNWARSLGGHAGEGVLRRLL